ncbi:GNAT family N-acetyltransferase [Pseudoalteromonas sp. SG45-5]|nr:GNAT family N-acetyltransferase [Pseudoalteromonas sp. SG45-5]MBB1395694.1 GNAT family N-acetyltransferase [Pseudoalteromonas sp. SG44-4]MBB1449245.1 GNAT family N-acetyltransferase [Pseudoalteromonas sp. SG41-6]
MFIRKVCSMDLYSIRTVCADAFMSSVAPTLQAEGIKTFQSIISLDNLETRMAADNEMYVYESNSKVVGFIELKAGRHIAMLFVAPSCQKKGIGKSLILRVLAHARSDTITVSASLTSVQAYLNYGFERVGDISESAGLIYQPMQIKLNKLNRIK